MRIGELSTAANVDVETIRYYEKIGLMPAPERGSNGYRSYSSRQLAQLTFIRHCRALDIGLADIRRLLEFSNHPDASCGDINHLIDEQLERVRTRLENLHALERQLQELRSCCTGNRAMHGCGILNELTSSPAAIKVGTTQP
ncbi:Cd(II)/Pb(II)-responsive transcriptional regulator [Pseudomonas sp. Choline-3u-10]|nr:Cd(II)/Pb(II)-responsive transcriptional regulator [Pseudomonas sp. 10B238]MAL35400.1 Cd(II)/Pb(II)-responsive transcriptional regulator [Pseudomonas sp.]MBK3793540.1 Cd(II)/Pb(II)-responsive transcriptional regulator [Stutzerimonas stutzeri]MBU0948324.1 Cd(II)/Pb(II)-responsive transcriptional regulator [Gammaproteobacteria bacterium]PKG90821.1 Cd(II)/Pb(II)-responsive transcriptional regulator [Pseudomonas sp. Choline-3u-10]